VWNVASGTISESFAGQPGQRSVMALDPGGTTAIVGSQDGSVASFDLTGVCRLGQEVTTNARLSCAGNTYGPCDPVSPHTNLLADTRSDGTVEIVNLRTLHQVEILPDHNGPG